MEVIMKRPVFACIERFVKDVPPEAGSKP